MKINEKDPNILLERTLFGKSSKANEVQQGGTKAQEASQAAPLDSVDISEKARTLQKLTQLVSAETEVRTERVLALQKEIEAGTYQPNAEQIAEKLVRSTLLDNTL